MIVFYVLQMYLKNSDTEYFIVDSFPVRAKNHKSFRAKIFRGKCCHGYTASKKAYFFGLKVHMIIDEHGLPIEFCISPGSTADIERIEVIALRSTERRCFDRRQGIHKLFFRG